MEIIGTVVLNYKNYMETEKCVNGLIKQVNVLVKIVIVDNGSGNESFSYLSDKFSTNSNVEIISLESNIGYARGNNIGITYLLKKGVNNIFICNSDIEFTSYKTISQLIKNYEMGVAALIPIIKNPDGNLEQRVVYPKKYLYLHILKHIITRLLNIKSRRDSEKKVNYVKVSNEMTGLQENNYVISGSAFLLTQDFFDNYKGLYPKTFLYYEEWATILLIHKAQLKCKIVDSDDIIHIGGASTPDEIKKQSKHSKKIRNSSGLKILGLLLTPAIIAKNKY